MTNLRADDSGNGEFPRDRTHAKDQFCDSLWDQTEIGFRPFEAFGSRELAWEQEQDNRLVASEALLIVQDRFAAQLITF